MTRSRGATRARRPATAVRHTVATAAGLLALATLSACGQRPEPFDPGQIVATEVIPPGRPMAEFNRPTIVREGTGEPVQVGDFVTLHKFRLDKQTGKIIRDRGVGWAWLGFLNARQTPFYTCHTENFTCEVDSAIVGMKVGTVFKYDRADWLSPYLPQDTTKVRDDVPGGEARFRLATSTTIGVW